MSFWYWQAQYVSDASHAVESWTESLTAVSCIEDDSNSSTFNTTQFSQQSILEIHKTKSLQFPVIFLAIAANWIEASMLGDGRAQKERSSLRVLMMKILITHQEQNVSDLSHSIRKIYSTIRESHVRLCYCICKITLSNSNVGSIKLKCSVFIFSSCFAR